MKTEKILQSDVLDIIFENRNKSYGAYTLRKFYNNRLYKALGAVLMLVVVLCSLSFLGKETPKVYITSGYSDPEIKKILPPITEPVPVKPKEDLPQKEVAAKPLTNTQKFTNNIIITKSPVTTIISNLRDSVQIGERDVIVAGNKHIDIDPAPQAVVPGTPSVAAPPAIDKLTPSGFAEVMPAYPGGMEALRKFMEKNLKNPNDGESGAGVSVKIRFVVGYDGSLKSFETVEDGGAVFNNEVVRVLKKMPQWIPGKTKGENVSVYYTMPVKFTSAE